MNRNGELGIYEVYYYKNGRVQGYTENPVFPRAYEGNLEDFKEQLDLYYDAIKKPVLFYENS
jgi:hypothetical protein